jgi:hypothetical protein
MSSEASHFPRVTGFKVGDWVKVRPLTEIRATLDAQASLDALPFMPEMARHCGGRFKVLKLAHKACDTIDTYQNRRMAEAVHLDLRCDGSAHGGCQAGCLLYWKTAWLEPAEAPPAEEAGALATAATARDLAVLERATRQGPDEAGEPRYRCQSTELQRATTPLSAWELRQYVEDVSSGNVTWRAFLSAIAVELYNKVQRHLRIGQPYPSIRGQARDTATRGALNLQPGELVQVRSREEILATLGANQKHRGLWFDAEMLPFCGGTFRVLRRVERIIDEKTGRMIRMRNDCIVLDGVVCSGRLSRNRLFCPRGIYAFWREAWLRRVADAGDASPAPAVAASHAPDRAKSRAPELVSANTSHAR